MAQDFEAGAPAPGFIEPCIPTVSTKVAEWPLWIHEVKQDGYRMIARRGDAERLLTRNGFDWTKRYPLIAAALERLPAKSATIECCSGRTALRTFASSTREQTTAM
jgi:bifunctional non-homologous end joining protein LigD